MTVNESTLTCIAPRVEPLFEDVDERSREGPLQRALNYTLYMDSAPGPDINNSQLVLYVRTDPVFTKINESDRVYISGSGKPITILVSILYSSSFLMYVQCTAVHCEVSCYCMAWLLLLLAFHVSTGLLHLIHMYITATPWCMRMHVSCTGPTPVWDPQTPISYDVYNVCEWNCWGNMKSQC